MTILQNLMTLLQAYGALLLVSALLMAFYHVVMNGKQSFRFQRLYLLAIPVVCLMHIATLMVIPQLTPEPMVLTMTHKELHAYKRIAPETNVIVHDETPASTETMNSPIQVHSDISNYTQSQAPNKVSSTEQSGVTLSPKDITSLISIAIPCISAILLLMALVPLMRLHLRLRNLKDMTPGKDHNLVRASWVSTPFSLGKTIFLPEGRTQEAEDVFIRHEQAHIHNRHYIDVWCIEILVRMLWFNPILWLVRKTLRDIHEFEADRCVLSQGIDSHTYQCLLVQEASEECIIVANGFNRSFIRRRIKEMKRKGITLGRVGKLAAILWILTITGAMAISAMPDKNVVVVHLEDEVLYVDTCYDEPLGVDTCYSAITIAGQDAHKAALQSGKELEEGKKVASVTVYLIDTITVIASPGDTLKISYAKGRDSHEEIWKKVIQKYDKYEPYSMRYVLKSIPCKHVEYNPDGKDPFKKFLTEERIKANPLPTHASDGWPILYYDDIKEHSERMSDHTNATTPTIQRTETETLVTYKFSCGSDFQLVRFGGPDSYLVDTETGTHYKARRSIPAKAWHYFYLSGMKNQSACVTIVFPPLPKSVRYIAFYQVNDKLQDGYMHPDYTDPKYIGKALEQMVKKLKNNSQTNTH